MLVSLAVSLLLAIAGLVLIVRSRTRRRPTAECGGCGYDVRGTIGVATRCPECGGELAAVGVVPAGRRTRPMFLWVGLALVAASLALMIITTSWYQSVASRERARAVRQRQATIEALQQMLTTPPAEDDADVEGEEK